MQIVFHAGAHNTDEDRIIKCLLKNRPDFSNLGVNVPPRAAIVNSCTRRFWPCMKTRQAQMRAIL